MPRRGRGRPSQKNNIMYFRYDDFINDLKKQLKSATKTIRDAIYEEARRNAMRLNLRTKKTVRFANNPNPVSDADRRSDIISSITAFYMEWLQSEIGNKAITTMLQTGVGAMEQNFTFKKSYVGLYYEYGIGGKQDPSGYWIEEMADENPFRRPGEPSVTRSRFKPRDKNGVWRDLGGNLRITRSVEGGRREPILKHIGDDFKGEFWFRRAFEKYTKSSYVLKQYKAALMRVNPFDYFVVKNKFVLGRD